MQRSAHHPLAAKPIDRIGRQAAKSIHQHPCRAGLAPGDVKQPQAPEGRQLILAVSEALGDVEDGGPGRDGVGRCSPRLHERHQMRCPELHLAAPVPARAFREAGQRALDPRAALEQERLVEPEWQRGGGERDADRPVPARGEGPVQRRPYVVEMTAVHGRPLERRPVPLGLSSLEDDLVVLGMASGHRSELPAVGELLERIDPRGLEQAGLRVGIRDLDDEQRFRGQVRHDVDHLRRVEVVGCDDGAGRLQRETAGEDRQPVQDGALYRHEQLVAPVEGRP